MIFPPVRPFVLVMTLATTGGLARPEAVGAGSVVEDRGGPQVVSRDEEARIHDLVTRYYRAYSAGDAEGFSRLWVGGQPDAEAVTALVTGSRAQSVAFGNVRLSCLLRTTDGLTARVWVDAETTRDGIPRGRSTWSRNFSFAREDGIWRVVSDRDAIAELASALVATPKEDEQDRILEAEAAMVGEALRRALSWRANAALRRQDTAGAVAIHRLMVRVSETMKDDSGLVAALRELALQERAAGDLSAAQVSLQRAYRLVGLQRDEAGMAAVSTALAGVYYQSQRYGDAESEYQKAAAFYERVGEWAAVASVLHSWGNVAYVKGDLDVARERYQKSLVLQEKAAQAPGVDPGIVSKGIAGTYQALGTVEKECGNYPGAVEAFERARERFATVADGGGQRDVEEALGDVHREQGAFSQSLQHYLAALRLHRTTPAVAGDLTREATLLAQAGDVYALEQCHDAALDYYTQSLASFDRAGSRRGQASVLSGIAGVHFARRAFAQALEHFEKSKAISEAIRDNRSVAVTEARIGLVYAASEQPRLALQRYERSLTLAGAAADEQTVMRVTVLLAGAQATLGNTQAAVERSVEGARLAMELDDLDAAAHAQAVKGEALRQRREYGEAEKALREAIAAIERARSVPAGAGAPAFFDDGSGAHLALVNVLMEQGRHDEAFTALEGARRMDLRRILAGGPLVAQGLDAEQRHEERRLAQERTSAYVRARRAPARSRADERKKALAAEEQLAAFRAAIYSAQPRLRALRAEDDPPALASAAGRILDPATAFLEYAVTEGRTYLFVATLAGRGPSGGASSSNRRASALVTRAYEIVASRRDLALRVAAFRRAIASRGVEAGEVGGQLYDLLLRPAQEQLGGKHRYIIVPDAALWDLPFQALQAADGHFLVERCSVVYAQSLAAAAAQATTANSDRTRGAAVALAAFAPAVADEAVEQLRLVRPDLQPDWLRALPADAQAVAKAAPAGRGVAVTGGEAQQAHSTLRKSAVVHLALPAALSDTSPFHSLLAWPPTSPGARVMELGEVLDWQVTAELVALPWALTDQGGQAPGAATVAMNWAWFVAGCPTVLIGQWLAEPGATTRLMRGFHRALQSPRARQRPSQALRTATLALLAGPYRHPYYWASLRLLGSDARR